MKFKILMVAAALFLSGCSTVTMVPNGRMRTSVQPTYEESKSFFLFGLVGEQSVDVKQICGKDVQQVQTQAVFMDSFLTVITLGIYSPRSVKIWCGK